MTLKTAIAFLALVLFASPAVAGASAIGVTPGSGDTYQVITNAGGNFVGMFGLCDGAAAAQCVAVKAASTAAVATDPALVVAISPNNSVVVTGTVTLSGGTGAITQASVSVTNSSTALLTAAEFSNFEKICVPLTATVGIWVNWAGVAAVTAAPSEYMTPGQCDTWVKSTGFLPSAAAYAISNSSATIAVVVEGN
jgi:hypothetical protein